MTVTNYSFDEFKNDSLGRIDESKNEVTVKDYIEINQSKGLGRLFTQIKLALQGKGWVDHQKVKSIHSQGVKKLAEKMDWNTIESVYLHSQAILGNNRNQRTFVETPGKHQLVGDESITSYKVTKKEYQKKLKSLDKEKAIAVAIEKLLKETVEEKEVAIRKEFQFLETFTYDKLDHHPNLGEVFKDYLKFLKNKQPVNTLHADYGKLEMARKIHLEPRASSLDVNKKLLVQGFIEYLTEKKMENRLTQPEQTAIRMAEPINELKMIKLLDETMQNPELAKFKLKGYSLLIQVMGNMNSFWVERKGDGGEPIAVEISEPEAKQELTMERVKYLKEKFTDEKGKPLEEFRQLFEMIEVIAVKNLENEKSPELEDFFDSLADCNNGEDIYKLINETYRNISA